MRQKVNGLVPITVMNHDETGSQPSLAPALFNKNQNSALCLPVLSQSQRIVWVHSDQLTLPVEKVSVLDEAFNKFPYLTHKKTLSLAERCSLHPDEVKVWFMAQRLLYGISWDSKDISEVRRKMFGGVDVEDKRRVKKKEIPKSEKQLPDSIAVKTTQTWWPKQETPKPIKDAPSEERPGLGTKPATATWQKTKGIHSFAITDESLDKSPSVSFHALVESSRAYLPEIKKQEEISETKTQSFQTEMVSQGSQTSKPKEPPKRKMKRRPMPRCTPKQLALIKIEFIKQQYPADEKYQEMSMLSGIPRYALVQWFSDMRYFIKRGKPRWMTVGQHKMAVANVKHEQFIRKKMLKKEG